MATKALLSEARKKAEQAQSMAAEGKRLYQLSLEAMDENPEMAEEMREISLKLLSDAEANLEGARALNQSVTPHK